MGTFGIIFFAFLAVTIIVGILVWKKFSLNTVIDSKVNVVENCLNIGDEGVTISRLAPSGKARFENGDFEVHSANDFISENQKVIVIKIEGYKIIVKLKTN
jgi:membrane-bound ClpP family serine protease